MYFGIRRSTIFAEKGVNIFLRDKFNRKNKLLFESQLEIIVIV